MIFRGCVQTAENRSQTNQQVDVAPATRDGSQVVQKDHERAQNEQGKHQHRNPCRTLFDVIRHRRRVAARSRNTVFVDVDLSLAGGLRTGSLGSRSSA